MREYDGWGPVFQQVELQHLASILGKGSDRALEAIASTYLLAVQDERPASKVRNNLVQLERVVRDFDARLNSEFDPFDFLVWPTESALRFRSDVARLAKDMKDLAGNFVVDRKGGRPPARVRSWAIKELIKLWTEVHGERPVVQVDRISGREEGSFLAFLTAFFAPLNVAATKGLGRAARRLLAKTQGDEG